MRDISAPPSRPANSTFTPSTPASITWSSDRLIDAAEAAALLQLLSDVFRDQQRAALRLVDFDDLQFHPPAGQVFQLRLEPVDFLAFAADDDPRPGRVQMHDHLVAGPFDFDLGMPANWYFRLMNLRIL